MTDPDQPTPEDDAEPGAESGAGYGNHAAGYEEEQTEPDEG